MGMVALLGMDGSCLGAVLVSGLVLCRHEAVHCHSARERRRGMGQGRKTRRRARGTKDDKTVGVQSGPGKKRVRDVG